MSGKAPGGKPFYYHPGFSGYDFGAAHPFRGERFTRFLHELENRFPDAYAMLDVRKPEPVEDGLLLLVHSRSYLDMVGALERRGGFLSPDTQVLPGSVDAARLIVGSTVAASKAALQGGLSIGFGGLHHAGRTYGEGFCIFNDVAVAAAALLGDGLGRILILDTDAHQGNGTMDIFYGEPRVLYISLHQDPRTLYPGRGFVDEIGNGRGRGYTINIPMPILAGSEQYERALSEIVLPVTGEFEPQIIIRNGGSDPLHSDTLTNLGLDLEGLSGLIRLIAAEASRARVPLVDLFLSGYGPYVTEGWLAIVRGLLGVPMELGYPGEKIRIPHDTMLGIRREMHATLEALKRNLKPYWSCFQ